MGREEWWKRLQIEFCFSVTDKSMSQESCRMPCLAAMQLTDLSCHVRPQGEREGRDLPLHSHSSGEDYASIRKPRFLHTLWLWSCRASCSGQEVLFYSEGSWKIQQGHFQKVWHLQRNLRSAKIKISSYNLPRLNVQMNLVWTNLIRNQLKFSWDKSFVIWKKNFCITLALLSESLKWFILNQRMFFSQ